LRRNRQQEETKQTKHPQSFHRITSPSNHITWLLRCVQPSGGPGRVDWIM
jgi:hypothetical protein